MQTSTTTAAKKMILISYVTVASLVLYASPRDNFEPVAPLRTWTIGLAHRVTGWPLYHDGVSICILQKDATIISLKMNKLSLADQRYLKANPSVAKAVFDPEAEQIALKGDIDELTHRLTAMEAAQRTGTFQQNTRTVATTVVSGTSEGTGVEGPSQTRIRTARTGRGPKANLAGLNVQTSQKTNNFHEVTTTTQTTATCVISDGSYTDGPALARINAVRTALLERKAKLAALKAAYPVAEASPKETD